MNCELGLPDIFSNGMIIRHGVKTAIWGTATHEGQIEIDFAGQTLKAMACAGSWRTDLPAVPPGGPYEIVVRCVGSRIVVRDILAGEVWIAGGQSNMEWPLKTTQGYARHIAAAQNPLIRSFNVQKLLYEGEPAENPDKFSRASAWRQAVPENVGEFSAVAYHFACDLHEKLGVPIGIIECNLGGSSASAWTSEEYLLKDPDVRSYLDEYNQAIASLDMEQYLAVSRQVQAGLNRMQMTQEPETELDRPFVWADLAPEMFNALQIALGPGPRAPFGHPGSLFRNMVQTITPYSVSGVIFYQGESDDVKARIYSKLFTLMIECWRQAFENPAMPFVFAQLSSFSRDGNPDGDMYAIVRDQQFRVAQTVPNTGMAVTLDVGSFYDIHPRRKEPVGQRLALVAREIVYGEPIDSSGPVYRAMRIEGNKIILEFDHATQGLACQGERPQGFRICGANRLYFAAEARIVGTTVELTSPAVAMPAAASYGWANYCEANLYNGAGLPAVPFKTDRYL